MYDVRVSYKQDTTYDVSQYPSGFGDLCFVIQAWSQFVWSWAAQTVLHARWGLTLSITCSKSSSVFCGEISYKGWSPPWIWRVICSIWWFLSVCSCLGGFHRNSTCKSWVTLNRSLSLDKIGKVFQTWILSLFSKWNTICQPTCWSSRRAVCQWLTSYLR